EVGGKWVINHDPYMEPEIQKMRKMVRNKQLDILSYRKALDEVDARLKKGITIQDALDKLTTTTSGDLNIEIEKPGKSNRIKVKLRCRDTIVDPVVAKELKGGITYIRIAQFNKRAEKEFTAEISKMQAHKAKGLILDVRNNPGGSLSSATYIASKITGGGTLATIQGRNTKRSIRLPKTRNIGIPIVVLVNGGTSSVAELFAGTLKDSQIATILGTKTFGDGLVQTPVVLKDGASAIVTTGKLITPGGVDFDKRGLNPDVIVESKSRKEDVQLAAAEKLLIGKVGPSKG
ncbi:MAG: S41 family peptidase, partial [Armatimonadota bacterium]|nr:S41 family peptidase [Armatimonadota bacterium]